MVSVVIVLGVFVVVESVMLRKECPHDEIHKSCAFYDQYFCWQDSDRLNRVRLPMKKLPHCRSGCYCRKGLVRDFPGGDCIAAANCRNTRIREILKRIPTDFPDY